MAADTAAKRYAAMLPLCPWRPLAVLPSGTVDAGERAAVLGLYGLVLVVDPAGAAPESLMVLLAILGD
jgi:hypothetical protein